MPSYIVVVSPSYGGAEKRFFDVFTALVRDGVDVQMVAPHCLVRQLESDHADRPEALRRLLPVALPSWGRLAFARAFRSLLRSLPRGSAFHYPMNCLWPLHLGRGDRLSMSVVDCTRVPSPFGPGLYGAWTWWSGLVVRRIDVLSPAIHTAMRGYRFAGRMSLTPGGTYVVAPLALSQAARQPHVVFLGRLVEGKGLEDLVEIMPALWRSIESRAPRGFAFKIAGYGALEPFVQEQVAALRTRGVPVDFLGFAAADALLAQSAVLLSLQPVTNFPSRVVAEALLAGCGVVVRDTGDSRQFGELPALEYCAARLDADELASKVLMLLNRVMGEPGFEAQVRQTARARFGSHAYVDYFRRLLAG
jgi:glycosyltransferase involved in cell wall biosynthesis